MPCLDLEDSKDICLKAQITKGFQLSKSRETDLWKDATGLVEVIDVIHVGCCIAWLQHKRCIWTCEMPTTC